MNDSWKIATGPEELQIGEIALWRVDIDGLSASVDQLFGLLSDDEKNRANKFVFAIDRDRFIACRGALRKLLGGYLRMSPEKVRLSVRQFGKPYVSTDGETLRFNLSHSRGIAVMAMSLKREVGVDVEFVDPDFDVFSVASSVFSSGKVSQMRSLPSNMRAETFFAGWTRREAFLKATGDGFSSSDELQLAVSMMCEDEGFCGSPTNRKLRGWSLTSFEIHENFKAALVVEGDMGTVNFWHLAADSVVTQP